jgi:hypothetical protein
MLNNITIKRYYHLIIAITIAIITTGFLRLQLFSGLPEIDGGLYTFVGQYFYYTLINGEALKNMTLNLYPLMVSWVYSLDLNQYILLRLIDGLVAIAASIVLFKVILKESGNTVFTLILTSALLIIMNDVEIIMYGFRNSIWAAFLPLFSALLIWQNSTKHDKYSFYLIGGLISLAVLLREPFLLFFLLGSIAILIGYGWRVLLKYLIGSALLGFTVLGFILMLRGWDFLDLVNSYLRRMDGINTIGFKFPLAIVKANWFIFTTATISILYIVKSYLNKKKIFNMKRVYFWLAVALLPLVEYYSKLGLAYHFANCLPGLAGLSALGWRYIAIQESKKTQLTLMILISLLSLMIILPTINKQIVQNSRIFSLSDASRWVKASDAFRSENMIVRSQLISVAAKVYELSKKNSTLAVSGYWMALYPLTELLPPKNNLISKNYSYNLSDLRGLYLSLNSDQDKLAKIIEDYRPSIIVTSTPSSAKWNGEADISNIIKKTNLYEKIAYVPKKFSYEEYLSNEIPSGADPHGSMEAIIYRLKSFK